MKYLLTIILFMSVNVFADFSITTLECDKENKKSRFVDKLSLRVDEKRKMIRLSLLPEAPFKEIGYSYVMQLNYKDFEYEIYLSLLDLSVNWGRLHKQDKEDGLDFLREFYLCKII